MASKSKEGNTVKTNDEVSSPSENIDLEIMMNTIPETISAPAITNNGLNVPLRTQREDEKNMLIGFNNRLAAIIEKNHQLEHVNHSLTKEVHKAEENLMLTKTTLETTYGKELNDARKLLLEKEKENGKLKLTESQLKIEVQELLKKGDKQAVEAENMKKKLSQADDHISKLNEEIRHIQSENTNLTKDNKDLEEEKFRLTRELTGLRCKYDDEYLANMELQQQLEGKIEENNLKFNLYQQEILQVKNSKELEIQELDEALQKKYELKLQDALKELRADYEMELERNREEQKNLYNIKEADLVTQNNTLADSLSKKIQELEILQADYDEALQKVANLEGEKYGLVMNVHVLENKLKNDKEKFDIERKNKDAENDELRRMQRDNIAEYLDLLETKTALDNELATYRVLLESEEQRLKLYPYAQIK